MGKAEVGTDKGKHNFLINVKQVSDVDAASKLKVPDRLNVFTDEDSSCLNPTDSLVPGFRDTGEVVVFPDLENSQQNKLSKAD